MSQSFPPKNKASTPPLIENMALRRLVAWGIVIALISTLIYLFSGVLLPFVLGGLIAYLLNPLIEPLEGIGAPRVLSAVGILFLFFFFVGAGLLVLTPILYREISEFAQHMPSYLQHLQDMIAPYIDKISPYIGGMSEEEITNKIKDNAQTALNFSSLFLGKIVAGTNAIIGFTTTFFLTPVVAFYMMAEWPSLTRHVNELIPVKNRPIVTDLLKKMDRSLAGFIRGQFSVCAVLGLLYGTSLAIMGLKFGFLIGLLSGIISFIPFVGSAFGLIASVTVAWFQFGAVAMVGIALAIFLIGQLIEGHILTPKLVGDSIQLHPLWIIFSLMAGGSLMGFTGMLIALPVAAMAGVLIRFALGEYKKSEFYLHSSVLSDENSHGSVTKKPKTKKSSPRKKVSSKKEDLS